MYYSGRPDLREPNKKKTKRKKKKPHVSIRAIMYGSISGAIVTILMHVCRDILEPHEAIKVVEFSTVSMLIFEHILT